MKRNEMDLLTIQHQDFTMYVECTKLDGIWNKATRIDKLKHKVV